MYVNTFLTLKTKDQFCAVSKYYRKNYNTRRPNKRVNELCKNVIEII